jgi:hypothetical protein
MRYGLTNLEIAEEGQAQVGDECQNACEPLPAMSGDHHPGKLTQPLQFVRWREEKVVHLSFLEGNGSCSRIWHDTNDDAVQIGFSRLEVLLMTH